MNEDDARRLLMVRAVESEDQAGALLTREDRQQADDAGLAGRRAASATGDRADALFLARRAAFAFGRLATRFPAIDRAYRATRWPAWLNWVLPLGALATGMFANEIDSGQRLNIIAFPLLGMLLWNFAVYGLLAAGAIGRLMPGRADGERPGLVARMVARLAGIARGPVDGQQPIGRALARFALDWSRHARALTWHRASRTLHLSAAALAAGVLLGMYLRALGIEYRAGWESTFIGTGTLHWLLGLVLGPASALTGIPLPAPEHLAALRWSARGGGENAGPWIHLYAATALLFIVAPRLLLAGWSAVAALTISRRFPVPGREDFYVRRLLRSAQGSGAEVRIIPYSFHPPEPVRAALQRLLTAVLGDATRTTIATPIDYGAEDAWLAGADHGADVDHIVLLFNLAATPEAETHGAMVAGLERLIAERSSGATMTVVLDESAYARRLGGQAGADARIESRRLAWQRVLAQHGVKPLAIDLESDVDAALVRRFEGGLLRSASLSGVGSAA